MTISGLPRPLPECGRCGGPMHRNRWAVATGVCRGCATPAEAMSAAQRAGRLTAVTESAVSRRSAVDARIERLAARRAARATGGTR